MSRLSLLALKYTLRRGVARNRRAESPARDRGGSPLSRIFERKGPILLGPLVADHFIAFIAKRTGERLWGASPRDPSRGFAGCGCGSISTRPAAGLPLAM